MTTVPHSEVLAHDWLPPVALGRAAEVDELVRRLDPPTPRAPAPWIVGIAGPAGGGTSTIARRAAREVVDRVRAARGEPFPRSLVVRTAFLRGTHGVVTALLQRLDEGFDGRGFPVPEILAGLLRRLRRDGRPVVVLLDDIGVGGPDLAPVLRAFANPDRFLPEGESGLPPIWMILAGTREGLASLDRSLGERFAVGPLVLVDALDLEGIRSIVRDRAERAMGQPAPADLLERIVRRTVEDGGGATRALDLLRRELLGVTYRQVRDGNVLTRLRGVAIEPWVVRAIGVASHGRAARLGEVKRLEAQLAQASGARPLPTTTLWRRIVRLEQAGYVRREIRTGGSGGTLSIVRVLTPLDEWVTTAHPTGSRPDGGPWTAPGLPQTPEAPELREPASGFPPSE